MIPVTCGVMERKAIMKGKGSGMGPVTNPKSKQPFLALSSQVKKSVLECGYWYR